MQLCVGTSLAIIVPTTIRSCLAHRHKGEGIGEVVRRWALPAVAGVAAGSALAAFAPGALFKAAFVVIAAFIAVKLLLARDSWRLGDRLPGTPAMTAYGFLIGLCSSLMGISGGSLANLVLTLYGRSIHNAVAISAGLGVPISLAGTIGYVLAGLAHQGALPRFSAGFVSLLGVLLMAPVSSFTAVYGVRLAHALSKRAGSKSPSRSSCSSPRPASSRASSEGQAIASRITGSRASSACRRALPSSPAGRESSCRAGSS